MIRATEHDVEQIANALGKAKRGGDGWWTCLAPCHEDKTPSFRITANDGRLGHHCFNGCAPKVQFDALKNRGLIPGSRSVDVRSIAKALGERAMSIHDMAVDSDILAAATRAFGEVPTQSQLHHAIKTSGLFTRDKNLWSVAEKPKEPEAPLVVYPCPEPPPVASQYEFAWPYKDKSGNVVAWHLRRPGKDGKRKDLPWFVFAARGNDEPSWKAAHHQLEDLPTYSAGNPDSPFFVICEGEKTADAIARCGYFVETPGSSNDLKKCRWHNAKAAAATGKTIILAADNDEAGAAGMVAVAEAILKAVPHAQIRIVQNPDDAPQKWDLADVETDEERRAYIESAEPYDGVVSKDEIAGYCRINLGSDLFVVAQAVLAELAKRRDLGIYHRAGALVEVIIPQDDAAAAVREICVPKMSVLISRCCVFYRGTKPAKAPAALAPAICKWNDFSMFPVLNAVVEHPCIVGHDAHLLNKNGYDDHSGILMVRGARKMPTWPRQEHAAQAAKNIVDAFGDFPFTDDAARACYLAYFLTHVARNACRTVPMFIFTANDQGAGKTKLACAPHYAMTKRAPIVLGGISRDAESLEKQITAFMIDSKQVIVFDNATGRISGEALAALITSPDYSGRILGRSVLVTVPNRIIVAVTSNNATIDTDQASRSIFVSLNAPPGNRDRKTYRHPDFDKFLRESNLVADAITIIQAYVNAGCPAMGNRTLRDFHEWCKLVCGSIMFAGLADPLANQQDIAAEADIEGQSVACFFEQLERVQVRESGSLTAARIVEIASADSELAEAIQGIHGTDRGGKITAHALGLKLHKYLQRNQAGMTLKSAGSGKNAKRWHIHRYDGKAPVREAEVWDVVTSDAAPF